MKQQLIQKDKQFVWHPFTQMQTAATPIPIVAGKDALLFDADEKAYIDAISSWWVNIHGHGNTYIAQKIYQQALQLEHCIFAGFTHPWAIELAERLLAHLPQPICKVFFSDNGSTAVEVALKMAFQYWHNQGKTKKKVIALEDAYHGDTFGAMSVSARSAFTNPFSPFLFEVEYLPSPADEPRLSIERLEKLIALHSNEIACFVYEPLVQGAGGMKMYSPETLNELLKICKKHHIICIADEVMVGFYRTGTLFASNQAITKPDIICLSKGLTGGTMPLGITACSQAIYNAFLSEDKFKTFFHGHSFTANPIACTSALASLDLLEKTETLIHIERITAQNAQFKQQIENHKKVKSARQTGTILAIDINFGDTTSYFNEKRDAIYHFLLQKGVLMRPLGNVIYTIPPYCITQQQLQTVFEAITDLLNHLDE